MAIDTEELEASIEAAAAAEPASPPAGGDAPPVSRDDAAPEPGKVPVRLVAAVAMPTLACAVMVGGIFEGLSARLYAGIAGLLGIGVAVVATRLQRRVLLQNVFIVVGLFVIGLLVFLPDVGDMFRVTGFVSEATAERSLLRPPVPFDPGWKALVAWLLAIIGFGAAWMSISVGARAVGLLIPLPIAAIAGISVQDSEQVVSGAVVLVLFAIGLGLLSSENQVAEGDESSRPGLGYELRRAARALPLIAILVAALVFGQDQLSFLFPDPIVDPAQEPQKPKTRPLTEVDKSKVLFEVRDAVIDGDLVEAPTGPWRTGVLDVYDGEVWRLPPFASEDLHEVDQTGFLDPNRAQVAAASITLRGLTGLVLPALPNSAAIGTKGVELDFDPRAGVVRMHNGQVPAGLQYVITASGVPSVADLKAQDGKAVDSSLQSYLDIPEPPPAVEDLLAQAETEAAGPSRWERFDWLRTWILDNVTASGPGIPVEISPDRVAEMITAQSASPFEIVAAQAMLARWVGVPSRIGFGFDGGELQGDVLLVRPTHGAAWVEVSFGEFGWLPVIGTPKKAEPSVGDTGLQKFDPSILPGDDVGAKIYVPLVVPPESVLGKQIAVTVLGAIPVVLLALLLYFAYPAVRKLLLRSRRRSAALEAGLRARVALAYSELRDYATDLGYRHPTDTPLMFLDRVMDDREHMELAWLTTRVLWGDLRDSDDLTLATTAEELSRSLRRRLGLAQPASVRALAVISRLSLRQPYDPAHSPTPRTGWRRRAAHKEAAGAPVPA